MAGLRLPGLVKRKQLRIEGGSGGRRGGRKEGGGKEGRRGREKGRGEEEGREG